jgi:hypothetical protein
MTSQICLILTCDSMPVEPFSIKNTDSLKKVLYKTSTDIGLQNSKELCSLKTADTYGTISMVDSTGNAPKSTCTQTVRYIFADDVYTNLEQICAKEAMDINSNKNIPNNSHQ